MRMSAHPRFSVIIPTKNRPQSLYYCLESFTRLEYPDWELIVVNDGGKEAFSGVPKELREILPISFVDQKSSGPAVARNRGARMASGDYLAFTDDDCRVEPDWLLQLSSAFTKGHWDAIGGRALNPYHDQLGPACWHFLIDFLYEYWQDKDGNALMLVANNAAYQREVFEALGGFDGDYSAAGGEDRELSYRLLARGYSQTYCPEAKVWHYQQGLNASDYVKQQFRYGRSGYLFRQKTKRTQDYMFSSLSNLPYPVAVWRKLLQKKAPLSLWIVVNVAQIAHRIGRYYEGIRKGLDIL
jgi:glycosyltransferase involved in cell wall biosynthesis